MLPKSDDLSSNPGTHKSGGETHTHTHTHTTEGFIPVGMFWVLSVPLSPDNPSFNHCLCSGNFRRGKGPPDAEPHRLFLFSLCSYKERNDDILGHGAAGGPSLSPPDLWGRERLRESGGGPSCGERAPEEGRRGRGGARRPGGPSSLCRLSPSGFRLQRILNGSHTFGQLNIRPG